MKTLLINIYRDITSIYPNTEIFNAGKDNILDGFYISLGMAIAEGVTVSEFKPLVAGFASDKPSEFESFRSQWEKLKPILLGDNPQGKFDFQLSSEYLEWLKINASTLYYQKFQGTRQASVIIDIEELYEDTVFRIRRRVLRYLQENNNYNKFEDFVVNDNQVNRRSRIVRAIKEQYEDIAFVMYEKWSESITNTESSQTDDDNIDKNGGTSSEEDIFIIASDRTDEKWFSEFYTKAGKQIVGKYDHINNAPFYHYDNRYFHICDKKLKEVDLNDCVGAIPYDEENAGWNYLILKKGKNFFVINEKGNVCVPFGDYDEIRYAYGDCVLARKKSLWGVISLNNEIIIPFHYDDIAAIGNYEHRYFSFYESEYEKTGVIDDETNILIDAEYEEVDCIIGDDGSVWFKVCQDDYKYGIVDNYGNSIIPLEYDEIDMLFDNGSSHRAKSLPPYFKVKLGNELAVIDCEGEEVVPFDNYENIEFDSFSDDNNIIASYEDEYDYMESRWINPPYVYEIPDEFCAYDKNGLRICQERPYEHFHKETQEHYLKNKRGRVVYSSFCDSLCVNGDPYGYNGECYIEEQENEDDYTRNIIIGNNGNVLGEIPEGFSEGTFVNGMALCFNTEKGEACIINLNGRIIKRLPKNEKSYLAPFQNGKLFFIDNDGNVGYYDDSLSRIITCNNKYVEKFVSVLQEGILCVKTKNDNFALLHWNTGKLIEFEGLQRIDCLHGPRTSWHEAPPLMHDYFLLRKNDKYTLINKEGHLVISNEYTLMSGVI